MDLELHQVASLKVDRHLSEEELDKIMVQVADIENRKQHILALLHICIVAARAADNKKILKQ
jgi:hypothetical protein